MKRLSLAVTLFIAVMFAVAPAVHAESIMISDESARLSFPDLTEPSTSDVQEAVENSEESSDAVLKEAVWPFSRNEEGSEPELKTKSTRKAFFLSMLVPGLGETYVGSKRGIAFFAVEALSWWMYLSNTNEGNDLEDDYQRYADTHWHYTETTASGGSELDHNYWLWLKYQFQQVNKFDDTLDPKDYKTINELLDYTVQNSNSPIFGHSIHNLPSTKTQQYYEMIGKYPQFVYGWEDVGNTSLNPTIRDDQDKINMGVAVNLVKSPMRIKYEDMRDDSNNKLKAGQRGIHLMLISRVVSAVHAGRLAYHHNQKMKSELSSVKIDIVQKQIIDNKVPMILLTKKF